MGVNEAENLQGKAQVIEFGIDINLLPMQPNKWD